MQMNKAILRNSEIVIFEKKKIWDCPGEFFSNRWIGNRFFSRRPYLYSFAWIKDLIDKNFLNSRKPRGEIFHTFVSIFDII